MSELWFYIGEFTNFIFHTIPAYPWTKWDTIVNYLDKKTSREGLKNLIMIFMVCTFFSFDATYYLHFLPIPAFPMFSPKVAAVAYGWQPSAPFREYRAMTGEKKELATETILEFDNAVMNIMERSHKAISKYRIYNVLPELNRWITSKDKTKGLLEASETLYELKLELQAIPIPDREVVGSKAAYEMGQLKKVTGRMLDDQMSFLRECRLYDGYFFHTPFYFLEITLTHWASYECMVSQSSAIGIHNNLVRNVNGSFMVWDFIKG